MKPLMLLLFMTPICLNTALADTKGDRLPADTSGYELDQAEQLIMVELVRELSPSNNELRLQCGPPCIPPKVLETTIGLLGQLRSDAALEMLTNLLGFQLTAEAQKEYSCQLMRQGKHILPTLEKLDADKIRNRCEAKFFAAREHELLDVTDVSVEQICFSPSDIKDIADDMMGGITSDAKCERW